jgi:hypothetical protein
MIWATQKGKSDFIETQLLQAIGYQSLSVLAGLLLGCYTLILVAYLMSPPPQGTIYSESSPLFIFVPCCLQIAYVGYGIWGGISILRGNNFRYLIIGSQIERLLTVQLWANRGDRAKFEAAMSKGADIEPEEYDRL